MMEYLLVYSMRVVYSPEVVVEVVVMSSSRRAVDSLNVVLLSSVSFQQIVFR